MNNHNNILWFGQGHKPQNIDEFLFLSIQKSVHFLWNIKLDNLTLSVLIDETLPF